LTHYAKVENNIVTDIIVAEKEFIDKLKDSEKWIKTGHNIETKNYACIGDRYDKKLNGFIAIQPYKSWTLNKKSCIWEPPIAKPKNKNNYYSWNEIKLNWNSISYEELEKKIRD
tara:strand:+ start:149 stop:490 length:342 start_codon:yes stop_codon:yes gene_type:complete